MRRIFPKKNAQLKVKFLLDKRPHKGFSQLVLHSRAWHTQLYLFETLSCFGCAASQTAVLQPKTAIEEA